MDDTQAQPVEATEAQGDPAAPADLEDAGKKALVAERKRAAAAEKQAKALQDQLEEIKRSQMSDLEKAQAQAQAAQAAAEKAASEALRWRIAARHGISDEHAEMFLVGTDEDTLTRQAETLAALAKAPQSSTTPRPDLSQGARSGGTTPLNGDGLEQALRQKLGI